MAVLHICPEDLAAFLRRSKQVDCQIAADWVLDNAEKKVVHDCLLLLEGHVLGLENEGDRTMALWHCHDRLSGERFEVHGTDEDEVRREIESYIRDGIDADTGEVGYDVTATAVDGSEYSLSGTV